MKILDFRLKIRSSVVEPFLVSTARTSALFSRTRCLSRSIDLSPQTAWVLRRENSINGRRKIEREKIYAIPDELLHTSTLGSRFSTTGRRLDREVDRVALRDATEIINRVKM